MNENMSVINYSERKVLPSSLVCNFFIYFVNCASRYNCVKKIKLMHSLFLVYFVNLYMFRAYLGPSSGGTAVCIQQLVLIILL